MIVAALPPFVYPSTIATVPLKVEASSIVGNCHVPLKVGAPPTALMAALVSALVFALVLALVSALVLALAPANTGVYRWSALMAALVSLRLRCA